MQQLIKHLGPSDKFALFFSLHFWHSNSWDHCLFLYFSTQLKDRIKQTFKYDQMLLMPSHSIGQYYSQNISRMFIFPVNLTVHGFGGGDPKERGNLEDW